MARFAGIGGCKGKMVETTTEKISHMPGRVNLPDGAVTEQLERILASPQFAQSSRLSRFLSYVVEQSIAGDRTRLKGYTIGIDVFDKNEDFDPQIDTIVRVQAGKLRQRLDLYYADAGRHDPVRILIPKGSYAPVFQLALETGPTGDTVEAAPGQRDPKGLSIVVLPFAKLGVGGLHDHLADGITEEITNALSRFREITVIAQGTRRGADDPPESPRDIAARLGVTHLLHGSVRSAGSSVRVTVRLVDGATQATLLSETYDRDIETDALFQVQDDIAAHIAAEVAEPHGVLSRIDSRWSRGGAGRTGDAYDAVLAAFAYLRAPTEPDHARVRARLEQVAAANPVYSSAWAMLAILIVDELRGPYNTIPDPPPMVRAIEVARHAVDCDPLNANAYLALALAHFFSGDLPSFRNAAERALNLNAASPDVLADCGICLAFSGEWERGLGLVQKALRLCINPPPWYHAFLAINAYRLGADEEALVHARRGITGAFRWGPLLQVMCLGQLGRGEEAVPLIGQILEIAPDFPRKARAELELWNLSPELIDRFCDGWRKAGLQVT